jgi:hypothetical protein
MSVKLLYEWIQLVKTLIHLRLDLVGVDSSRALKPEVSIDH